MPGGQLPLMAAGLVATLLPPPLVQADVVGPSTMVAQMPIAAETLVMTLSSAAARWIQLNAFPTAGVRRHRLQYFRMASRPLAGAFSRLGPALQIWHRSAKYRQMAIPVS